METPKSFRRKRTTRKISSPFSLSTPLVGGKPKLPDRVPKDQNLPKLGWSILRSLNYYGISIGSVVFIDMMFLGLGLLIGKDTKWGKVVPVEKKFSY